MFSRMLSRVALVALVASLACEGDPLFDGEGPEPTLTPSDRIAQVDEPFTLTWSLNSRSAPLDLRFGDLRWDQASTTRTVVDSEDPQLSPDGRAELEMTESGTFLRDRYEFTFVCRGVGTTTVEFLWSVPKAEADPDSVFSGNNTASITCVTEIMDGGLDGAMDAGSDGEVRMLQMEGPVAMAASVSGGALHIADERLPSLLRVMLPGGELSVLSGSDDQVDGEITGTGPDFDSPIDVATVDENTSLVLDAGTSTLVRVNQTTGERTIVSGGGVGTGPDFDSPKAVVNDFSSSFAYVVNGPFGGAMTVYRVDRTTGERVLLSTGPLGSGCAGLLLDPDGNRLLTFIANDLVAIDLDSGEQTVLIDFDNGPDAPLYEALTMDESTNRLAVASSNIDGLSFIDLTTSDVMVVSDSARGAGPEFVSLTDLVWFPTSGRIFVSDQTHDAVMEVDTNTGDRAFSTMPH